MQRVARHAIVPDALAGARFDQAAAAVFPEFSRTRLKSWIDAGALTLGGAAAEPKTRLRGGEELQLDAELEPEVPLAGEAIPLQIVYEDAALLVVDKPAGLVVHPGAGNPRGTLQNALLGFEPDLVHVPRAGLVHRLDKETSGLLAVARTLEAQTVLSAAIERREMGRRYAAVCQTNLSGGGVVDAPIGRHPRDRVRMAVTSRGRQARTRYRVLERFRAHTCIEAELDTGRTHQIRVHMAHIRAPLVGDPVYGGRPRLPKRPSPTLERVLGGFRRQALHAARLQLSHPVSGETMSFESPLPADFEELLAALREDAAAEAARG